MSQPVTYTFRTAGAIVTGRNSLQTLTDYLPAGAKHALIISQSVLKSMVEETQALLKAKGVSSDVYLDIEPEPPVEHLEEVHAKLANEKYDVYIGLGGGSVLDSVKILAVMATTGLSVRDMLNGKPITKPGIPMILIPTTSGTGSEVTPNAIVTIPEEELKVGIVSPYFLPKVALLDPMLTLSLPKPVTAATGMDAFTHAIESYISNKANALSDMFALEAIRLISRSLVTAYSEGDNIQAREDMLIGSMYGGMALTAAGTAAVHALAYPLGGKYKIAHGVSNAMLLPHVMRFNKDACKERLRVAAEAMGIEVKHLGASEAADQAIERMEEWVRQVHIPQDLGAYGVTADDLDDLAVAASKVTRLLNNNPKPLSLDDMKAIYAKLLK